MPWIFEDVSNSSNNLPVFLLQVFLTLVLTRFLGRLLAFIRQPPVVGEIIGGVFLGPSVLGQIPGFTSTVFPPWSEAPFVIVGNVGLIMFMFIMGVEVEPKLLSRLWKTSVPIAASAIVVPFGVGSLLSLWLYNVNNWDASSTWVEPSWTAFVLFTGTSFSFTAFPVLASILSATKLLNSPLGIQTIAAAAVDDVMAWTLLSIATAFSTSGNGINGFYVFLCAMIFLAVMLIAVRPAVIWIHGYVLRRNDEFNRFFVFFIFLLILTCAFTTEVIGIHAFFGSFVCGICMPKENGTFAKELVAKLDLLVVELFLPLYFANSGIRTDISQINSGALFGITILIIILAILVKFLPATLAAKFFTKRDWRTCAALGILMNTRGLVALIALNVGLSNGIFSIRLFTMFVLMAIVTTMVTAPMLWVLYQRKYEEEEEAKKKMHMALIARHAEHTHIVNELPAQEPVLFHPEPSEYAQEDAVEVISDAADRKFSGQNLKLRRAATEKNVQLDNSKVYNKPARPTAAKTVAMSSRALQPVAATNFGARSGSMMAKIDPELVEEERGAALKLQPYAPQLNGDVSVSLTSPTARPMLHSAAETAAQPLSTFPLPRTLGSTGVLSSSSVSVATAAVVAGINALSDDELQDKSLIAHDVNLHVHQHRSSALIESERDNASELVATEAVAAARTTSPNAGTGSVT